MSETYMPLWNIYDFDKTEGTFTLTDDQKTVLANAELIRISYNLLAREYEADTSKTPTYGDVSEDGYITISYPVKDTYYFLGEHYKLTFTSSTYTLEKI